MSGKREFPRDTRYVVTAPLVMAKCATGWHHLYDGDAVPTSIDPKQRDKLLANGMIKLRPDVEPDPTPVRPPARPAYPIVDDTSKG